MNLLHVFLIDNYDSFVFNLADEFAKRGARVRTFRNNIDINELETRVDSVDGPRLVVISPGPGRPSQAGNSLEIVRLFRGRIPIFGVCLGHQVIIEAFGGGIQSAPKVVHGKSSLIDHSETGLFSGCPRPLRVGRYHSLAAREVPPGLQICATAGETPMAIEGITEP
ncbi:MAG: aminodeoxychorismate/anthranilate synthase component II, partial [Planctomycetota bacterium]